VRWFNPAGAWVWPKTETAATYYFPVSPLGSQQYDPELLALFQLDARQLPITPANYQAYTLPDSAEFEKTLAQTAAQTALSWPPDLIQPPSPQLPLAFGDHLQLLAVSEPIETNQNTVRFITYWEIKTADPTPLVAFVHLTSDGIDIWGQQDWLDVRQAGLQPGDRFAQLHAVPINPDTPPGLYRLQLGLYQPDTLIRLPLTTADGRQTDRIFASTIVIPSPTAR
jgi:hypothetical protein